MNDPLRVSYRFCGALSRREARNFYYSFLLLPATRRRSMCALYAFLRHTDDLADEPGPTLDKRKALDDWRRDLDQVLSGETDERFWPGLDALADTVRRHEVPPERLHEVIDGVLMDLEPRPYATFEDLQRYCYHVASAVGLSCLHIWGYESAGGEAEARAEACGLALQLTNILRDVREDALNGRVYLPKADMERFGVSSADLTATTVSEPLRSLLAFEAERAVTYYQQSAPLSRLIAPEGRPAWRAIVEIYRALLDEIVRRDFEVLSCRVSLPRWRKVTIALRSLTGRFAAAPPLAVVDAVPMAGRPRR